MRLFFALLLLIAFPTLDATEVVQDEARTDILTPSLQNRLTRKIRLDNGLDVYLISDPDADQSAAALSVEAGSFDDPEEQPGTAHFLEHMLFLGTSEYPDEGSYHRFVSEHGGHTNAYTSSDHTNYAFAVNHDAFGETLDRFSWFFKEPLFNPSGVEREMQAVHQEHGKNIENDSHREYYVQKAIANPKHPFSRFQTGNLDTLKEISQDSLKQWYREHYSASMMHLVVVATDDLDTLQKMVEDHFQGIPDRHTAPSSVKEPVLLQRTLGHKLYVSPLKELRKLTLSWELPGRFARQLETQPDELVGYILGHEGDNSLLAQLKREGLAEGLSAGGGPLGRDNFTFEINITLTTDGLKSVDTVIERCFEAVARLQGETVPSYLFEEMQQMRRLNYQYQQRSDPFYLAMRHARQLIREPLATYPEYTLIPQKYDREATQEILSLLTPRRCLVTIVGKQKATEVMTNRSEPWLGGKYELEPIPSDLLERWSAIEPHANIDLPPANPLIPTSLALHYKGSASSEQPLPSLISNSDKGLVYYAPDQQYLVPESIWVFDILTPLIDRNNAESLVLGDLYVKAVEEQLNPFAYRALLAGLSYDIERKGNGLRLTINGYSQKAHRLLAEILKSLRSVSPTPQQFKTYKETLRLKYLNFAKETPLKQGGELLRTVIYKEYITEAAKTQAIKKIGYKSFLDFRDRLYDETYVKGTLHGNLSEDQALATWKELETNLKSRPYPLARHVKQEAVYLPQHHGPYYLNKTLKRQGNATVLMIQNGPYSFKRRAAQQILATAIEEPFYSALRTQQQTGYLVFNWEDVKEKQLYSFFATQSASHDARDLLARFELLIESFLNGLGEEAFPPERFETIKQSIITKLSQPPQNLGEMGARLHSLAFESEGDFDWVQKRIAGVQELTFEEFVTHAKESYGRPNHQRVAVLVHGDIETPNYIQYSRIRSPLHLKKMSEYLTKEEALALDRGDDPEAKKEAVRRSLAGI